MTTDFFIRTATGADGAAIAEIYSHHVLHGTATYDTVSPSADYMQEKIADIRAKNWPFLVATFADAVVGYAYATQFRDRPAYAYACENSIYIAPDRIRQGIGRQLLSALIVEAREFGFRQMVAVIGGAEPTSVALHTALGFEHAGRLSAVGWKAGRWLDSVYMQLALGAGSTKDPAP